MSKEAMKLALEVLKINLTLLKKINPYKGQEDLLSDSLGLTNKAITTLEAELAKPDFWEGYQQEPDKRQQALDKKAENARELGLDYEPAQQEPVAFLANGTRFKISYDNRQSGGQIHGIPPELGGRWVAFVAADDDCHLKLTSPPAQRTWVNLTPQNLNEIFKVANTGEGAVHLALKLIKEKNT